MEFRIEKPDMFLTTKTDTGEVTAFEAASAWLASQCANGWRPSPGLACLGNVNRCSLHTGADLAASVVFWRGVP